MTRLANHCSAARRGSPHPVCRWIRSLAEVSLEPGILLLEATPDRLRECVWIAYFKSRGVKLLNCTAGGEGLADPSDETRQKLRLAHLGKKLPAEQVARIVAKTRGMKRTPESIARMRVAQKGHATSDEAREKMRAAKMGKKQPPELVEKRAAALRGRPQKSSGPLTEGHKAKIASALLGVKRPNAKGHPTSPETRAKLSAQKMGVKQKPPTEATREKIAAAHRGKAKAPQHVAKVAAAVKKARDEGRYQIAAGDRNGRKLHPDSYPVGAGWGNAKLTDEIVAEDRRRYKGGDITSARLARERGVSQGVMYSALTGKTWKHVAESPFIPPQREETPSRKPPSG